MKRICTIVLTILLSFVFLVSTAQSADKIKAMMIVGQMLYKHNYVGTTPVLKYILESTGRFEVTYAKTPEPGGPMKEFQPKFTDYDVVIMNYDGDYFTDDVAKSFENYMKNGGGLVMYHEADNAFPEWEEYNKMIGLGGWGHRNEENGPMAYWQNGVVVLDNTPGPGGTHGPQTEYPVYIRDSEHPITKGLPKVWMHTKDELYAKLRGPAQNMHFLATAVSELTHRHEPVLFTVQYGKGRTFHTVMGHNVEQLHCVGFIVTFQRGVEWAATGKVTLTDVPDDFPTADKVSLRKFDESAIDKDWLKQFDK